MQSVTPELLKPNELKESTMQTRNFRRSAVLIVLLLTVLILSCSGCATLSPAPALPVKPPAMPRPPSVLMILPEPGTYSDAVQRLFKEWRLLLINSKPS